MRRGDGAGVVSRSAGVQSLESVHRNCREGSVCKNESNQVQCFQNIRAFVVRGHLGQNQEVKR